MHAFVVDQKKWISDAKFLHALNYCMLLPGPEAQQLATYIGWLLHGVKGGLVAGVLFVLPSVFILLGLSMAYVTFGGIPWVSALFYGLKPAVVAIVILALIKIGKKSLHGWFHRMVALVSFIAIFFLQVPFPYIILSAIGIALLAKKVFPAYFEEKSATQSHAALEQGYYLNLNSKIEAITLTAAQFISRISLTLLLWALPFGLFYVFSSQTAFWNSLSLFFTKAALITFGGAYAVLPYVAQVAVEKLQWLSQLEMIDGLALGETTPGPLIMVLAFVGFMAGYHTYSGSLLMGTAGLLATTYFTFLPCFCFILVGGPLIERTQGNAQVKSVLGVVTAAVVGVVLNLTVYFANAVVFPNGYMDPDVFSLLWVVLSFVAMHRFRLGMIPCIVISALAGLGYYLAGLWL